MNRYDHIWVCMILAVVYLCITACSEEPPPPPTPQPVKVVSKPIARPAKAALPAETKPAPPIKKRPHTTHLPPGFEPDKGLTSPSLPARPKVAAVPARTSTGKKKIPRSSTSKENNETGKLAKGVENTAPVAGRAAGGKYDPGSRVDPFAPLIRNEKEATPEENLEPEVPKRILTPLEKMDLNQIKLVAVVLMEDKSLAMVEEATGKGYEVRLGTYMGQNGGRVTEIRQGSIIVKERVSDFKGKRSDRFQEIKLHKTENGE